MKARTIRRLVNTLYSSIMVGAALALCAGVSPVKKQIETAHVPPKIDFSLTKVVSSVDPVLDSTSKVHIFFNRERSERR